jgi:hypothetical protein
VKAGSVIHALLAATHDLRGDQEITHGDPTRNDAGSYIPDNDHGTDAFATGGGDKGMGTTESMFGWFHSLVPIPLSTGGLKRAIVLAAVPPWVGPLRGQRAAKEF